MNVVFTAAIMDMFHEGHANLINEMKKRGNHVIVILHDDYSCYRIKGRFPVQPLELRKKNVEHFADEVWVTYETDPADQFAKVLECYPDAEFVRGNDNMTPPGKWLLSKHGTAQHYIPYTKSISSSKRRDEM